MDLGENLELKKTRARQLPRDGGFVLVLLLSLLPLILTVLLGVAALIPLMQKLRTAEDLCRKGTLTSQARLLKGLHDLMRMSAASEKLYHLEVKALRAVRLSAGQPAALSAAVATLKSIQNSQRSLNAAQRLLRRRTDHSAHLILKSFTRQVAESQRHLTSSYASSPVEGKGAQVLVETEKKGTSLIFHPHKLLENRQIVSAAWRLDPLPHFGSWTRSFFPEIAPLKIQCSASAVKKGEHTWEPLLNAVKRQWSF